MLLLRTAWGSAKVGMERGNQLVSLQAEALSESEAGLQVVIRAEEERWRSQD